MKQIIANQNLVFPEKDNGVEVDTSALAALGIVHYEINDIREWVERDPFGGPEEVPEDARAIIDDLIEQGDQILSSQG